MPNWCYNELWVRILVDTDEAKAQLAMFRAKARGGIGEGDNTHQTELSFKSLYPMPEGEYWYSWNIEHWGTKWDVEADVEFEDTDYIKYLFDSAWSPPLDFLKKVSRDYPLLEFMIKYDEPGMGFMGVGKAVNGHLTDNCLEY